jgi:hypothetical protein
VDDQLLVKKEELKKEKGAVVASAEQAGQPSRSIMTKILASESQSSTKIECLLDEVRCDLNKCRSILSCSSCDVCPTRTPPPRP